MVMIVATDDRFNKALRTKQSDDARKFPLNLQISLSFSLPSVGECEIFLI